MKVFKNIRNHWQAVTETELSADMVLRDRHNQKAFRLYRDNCNGHEKGKGLFGLHAR
jgi:hypothetical protein